MAEDKLGLVSISIWITQSFFEPCMWKIAESLLLYAVKNSEVNNVLGQKYIFLLLI